MAMRELSPGDDVYRYTIPSLGLDSEQNPGSTQNQHQKESSNVPMDVLPFANTQLLSVLTERDRQDFIQNELQIWKIAEERLTTCPDDYKSLVNRKTYTSFGDHGMTGSVSAYGHLLQLCQYFGICRSGFFCVDLPDVAEAWVSNVRLRNLLEKAESNVAAIGLDWKEIFGDLWDFDDMLPRLDFVDDRWPRFTSSASDELFNEDISRPEEQQPAPKLSKQFILATQYYCNDGTIFQRCTLERKAESTEEILVTQLKLKADLLIRNLDFTDSIDFNEDFRDLSYRYQLGPNDESFMIIHEITPNNSKKMGIGSTNHEKLVALTITAHVNGRRQVFVLDNELATITLGEDIQRQVAELGVLDIVLTYRLQFGAEDDDAPISLSSMTSKFSVNGKWPYQKVHFSSHPHLDFIIRRNLEHILSVCSIPVAHGTSATADGREFASVGGKDLPVALTCGDISGHHVGLAASFYAIQFLREMLQFLKKDRSAHIYYLRRRIQQTCERHLKWVLESTDAPKRTDDSDEPLSFSPHYWASGQPVISTRYLPGPSLVDTPLQILKISDDDAFSAKGMLRLSKRVAVWLQELDEKDAAKRYAFSRTVWPEVPKFHLADHVRISQALSRITAIAPEFEDSRVEVLMKRFSDKTVRNSILKRFITENPISNQRTIATSRTASGTRFLFHSKDTALFHAMDTGLFSRKGDWSNEKDDSWRYLRDEWRSTIECQGDHEETQQLKWRKPLWYALSFILASKERKVNGLSPESLFNTSWRKLLGISSRSGLFPGMLTKDQPTTFDDETYRDNYWQTTFEIPYILWKYGKERLEAGKPIQSSENEKNTSGIGIPSKTRGVMTKRLQFANSNKIFDPKGLVEISDDWLQTGPRALKFRFKPDILELLSSNSPNPFIDGVSGFSSSSESVVSSAWRTYHDEGENGKKKNAFSDGKGKKALVIDVPRSDMDLDRDELSKKILIANEALAKYLDQERDVQSAKKRIVWLPRADKETALICCLACPPAEQGDLSMFFDRHALYDKYFSDETSVTLNEWKTEFHLSFYRRAEFASPVSAEKGIPEFSYVVPQLLTSQKDPESGEAGHATGMVRAAMGFRFVGDFFDRYWTCHFLEYLPGEPMREKRPVGKRIQETRKLGDRANPATQSGSSMGRGGSPADMGRSILDDGSVSPETLKNRISNLAYIPSQLKDSLTDKRKYPWQQRKVLELLLFGQILLDLEIETRNIFDWVRGSVLEPSGRPDEGKQNYSGDEKQDSVIRTPRSRESGHCYKMAASNPLNPLSEAIINAYQFAEMGGSDAYFKITGRWRLFEEILQALGEDLNENLERISEWSTREKDREPESPRWTRNDEQVFRSTMNRLRVQNQRKMRDLERLSSSIQTFRDSLSGRLESIREDMSFKGSENMSLFTYVTVVFLPLGFATGIFSMSDPPRRLTLAFMIATAVTSLSITVLALANAKSLLGLAKRHGKPVITMVLFALYSCLFVVYAVRVVLCLIQPIYDRAVKPVLNFLGREEHLERYKKSIYPVREFDLIQKISGWMEEERRHDLERQQDSHETGQEHTARRS